MNTFSFSPGRLSLGLLLAIFTSHALVYGAIHDARQMAAQDPAAPPVLSCGSIVNGTISAPAQVDQYTYAGEAGEIITLSLANTGGFAIFSGIVANATLYNPADAAVASLYGWDPYATGATGVLQITLATNGNYVIQVNSSDFASSGTYTLGLQCRSPLRNAKALTCGAIANGTLGPAQVDQYAYAGEAGGIVTLTLAGGLTSPYGFNPIEASATLFDPSGTAVATVVANGQKVVPLMWTGTYLIQVSAQDFASTGSYSVGLECFPTLGDGFIPVTPCRIADTRSTSGFPSPFGPPSMTGGSTRTFPVPSSSCGIPSTAQAYSLNVTVVPPAPLGYLSIWPTGELQPLVSTLNSSDGQVVANAAIVPAGTNGALNVYVSDNTDVIIDIDGYFVPAANSSAAAFYADTPCRIADTRSSSGFPAPFGPPSMLAETIREFPIRSSSCVTDKTAQAYVLNVTVVPGGELDYLSLWPSGEPQPVVSTLNSLNGRVVANAALVPAGSDGGIDVYVSNNTDVLIDLEGHFDAPGTNGLSFYPVSPCRVVDTRSGSGLTDPFGPPSMVAGTPRNFPIPSSSCGIPSTAQAYSLNITVVPSGALDYLTAWPTGEPQPLVSTLNSFNGTVVANAAIVPTGTNGAISVYVTNNCDLIIDVNGYFAP